MTEIPVSGTFDTGKFDADQVLSSTAISRAYVASHVEATARPSAALGSPEATNQIAEENEDEILASLSPPARWRYFAKNHPIQFIIAIIALIVSCLVIVESVSRAVPDIFSAVSMTAHAQGSDNHPVSVTASDNNFRWAIAGLMAVALLWSFGIMSFATSKEKTGFAKESIKNLSSFFFGLMTGQIR